MSVHRESQREAYDVVVIGSGIGGLSAAAFLAKAGKRVLVVERHDRPGGFAHGFQRGKYRFDAAVHVINRAGGLVETVLSALGVAGRCTFLPVEPFYSAVFPGFRFDAPSGTDTYVSALAGQFPHQAQQIRQLVELCSRVLHETRQAPIELSFWDTLRAPARFPTLFRYRSATLEDVLDEYLTDPRLKAVFAALWGYHGSPPSRLAFTSYATMIASFIQNQTLYCQGGFQNLANAFVESLQNSGGELLLRNRVRRVILEDGQVRGVVLENGQRIRAPLVISNADATQTIEELVGVEHLPRRFVQNLRRMKPSLSALVTYMGTDLDLAKLDIAHETLSSKYWDHEQTYRDLLAGYPAEVAVTVPTLVDPSMAPPGEHIVTAATLIPYDVAASWREEKARYGDLLLDELETVLPGLREHITFSEGASPRTMERYTLNRTGAVYGWEQSPRQAGRNRLTHATPLPGLYLSGHWTQPGGGVVSVIVSGIRTSALILGYPTIGDFLQAMQLRAA